MRRLSLPIALVALAAACTSAPDAAAEPAVRTQYLMGTLCTIELPATSSAALDAEAAFREIARVEALLSTWRPGSPLSRVNAAPAGEPVAVSPELARLLARTLELSRETGGAFSPLAGRLIVELWDLRGEGRVPSDEAIARATAAMRGDVRIDLDASTATRTTTATFEEGAFGKGYALDRAVEILRARGVRRAAIDFGGQIVRYGFDAPAPLGIAHPEDRARAAVEIVLADGSVSTSSGSEKTFGDGRYSHIVDPRTGIALPPRGSVTVVHPSALAADVFSTALYVLGPVEGRAWADRHEVAAIWLVPDPPGSYRIVASRAARSRSPTPVDPYFT